MKFHEESFTYVVGVDVSKEKLDVALAKKTWTIGNNPKAIEQLIDQVKGDSVIVVMEAAATKTSSCKFCTSMALHWL